MNARGFSNIIYNAPPEDLLIGVTCSYIVFIINVLFFLPSKGAIVLS